MFELDLNLVSLFILGRFLLFIISLLDPDLINFDLQFESDLIFFKRSLSI